MKKLVTLLLAAGMVFSAANGASAVEMKVSGSWLTSFTFADNLFNSNRLLEDAKGDGSFNAAQRIRINFDMVASESLSGRVQLQVANENVGPQYYTWGTSGVGGTGKTVTARLDGSHHRCAGAHGPSGSDHSFLHLRFSRPGYSR